MAAEELSVGSAAAQTLPAKLPRGWKLFVAGLILVLLGSPLWLARSESGLRFLCRTLEAVSAGQLEFSEAGGVLAGPLYFQSVRWRSATLDVELQGLQLDWRPADLWQGSLSITNLTADVLRVASAASEGATPLPASLRLPLSVDVPKLALGRVEWAELGSNADAVSLAEAINLTLHSDGVQHRVSTMLARSGPLQMSGDATLEGDFPFGLAARLSLAGDAAGQPLALDLSARGSLEEIVIAGASRDQPGRPAKDFSARVHARLAPFAVQPVLEAVAHVSAFDPAAWFAGAPAAQLDGRLELLPLAVPAGEPGNLKGALSVLNRSPGGWGLQRLPLESLKADMALRDGLQISALDLRVIGGGRLQGSGVLRDDGFAGRGSLKDVDPSRLGTAGQFPVARLNAKFDVQGKWQPALALGLHFELQDSRIAGKAVPLTGHGAVELQGAHLRHADVELAAAGNRLSAKGAFGSVGETLKLSISAPRLGALGFAGLSGDLSGQAEVGGSADSPELSGNLQSTQLAVPSLGAIKALEINARLGAGEQGVVAGKLRMGSFAPPSRPILLSNLVFDAEGVRSRHRLHGQLSLPEGRLLRLGLEGGFAQTGVVWAGALNELSIDAAAGFRLAAPAPLRVGAQNLTFGPASIQGRDWSARVEHVARKQGVWQSAGSVRSFPLSEWLADFSENFRSPPASVAPSPLRLSGEWNFSRLDRLEGQTSWRRESGDVSVGGVALGLNEAELNVTAKDARISARLKLRGSQLGSLAGDFEARLGGGSQLEKSAPWRGLLRADVADLSWAGPLLGEGFQLGGRLAGEVALTGSSERPKLAGEWRGDELVVSSLDQGMRLERGKLLLTLADGAAPGDLRLQIRQLSFASVFQAVPRVLTLDKNIDVAKLTAEPGKVDISGELGWGKTGQTDARLALRLDRFGVMQKADRWILVSGDGEVKLAEHALDVQGAIRVDAAYWALPKNRVPHLSDDVVVMRSELVDNGASTAPRWLALRLDADLGRGFYFSGAGLESRLVGALKVESAGGGMPRARGTIRMEDGRFDAYGQKLEIERGIVNFQGLIDNPGLNVRAVRKNLPVEAGVEITGSVLRPNIRLVSDPTVPDTEKLSWLVLGHAPDAQSGQDSSLLLAAAGTILGGQEGGGALRRLQQSLGVDDFAIDGGSSDGYSRRPTSRVAGTSGFGGSETVGGQVVSVGKRLSSNARLSYEHSLTTTENVVKLTINLKNNFSVVGRAGSDSALDFFWNYSFGKRP